MQEYPLNIDLSLEEEELLEAALDEYDRTENNYDYEEEEWQIDNHQHIKEFIYVYMFEVIRSLYSGNKKSFQD